MNITEAFNENGYVFVSDVIPKELCDELTQYFLGLKENGKLVKDDQCPLSYSVYGDPNFDKLLNDYTEYFSEISGKTLIPTYSYARIYEKGEVLKKHTDRPACEISATILLGYSGNNWPISMGSELSSLLLEKGSAVLYKGMEVEHWRDEFEGEWLCQVFLHYVDANGPYKDEKFDKRPNLGLNAETKQAQCTIEPIYYWVFENVLSSDFCNSVIGQYSYDDLQDGLIGSNTNDLNGLNKDIRNVKKKLLPIHQGIGPHLIGNAIVANQQAWRFHLSETQQIEYLKYDKTGRYKSHLDTFISTPHEQCRKLTALAFLNDDFEGGKLYLQVSDEKIYPPQSRGTVLVFPSFLLHGVEDVISGTRHSVVCWLLGPYFK